MSLDVSYMVDDPYVEPNLWEALHMVEQILGPFQIGAVIIWPTALSADQCRDAKVMKELVRTAQGRGQYIPIGVPDHPQVPWHEVVIQKLGRDKRQIAYYTGAPVLDAQRQPILNLPRVVIIAPWES